MRTIKISIEIIETEEKVNKKVSLFEQIKNQVESFKTEKEESMRTMVENVRQLIPISDKLLSELNEYVGLEFYKKSKHIQTTTINNERKEVFRDYNYIFHQSIIIHLGVGCILVLKG